MFIGFSVQIFHLLCLFQLFILFDATINAIVFLISFAVCSLRIYITTTDFYILISYPETFRTNLLVIIVCVCVCVFLRIFYIQCLLQIDKVSFIPLQFGHLLFLFLILLSWTKPPVH